MGDSAHNANAPSDIMEAIQTEMLSSQAEKIDDDIWNGTNALTEKLVMVSLYQFAGGWRCNLKQIMVLQH